MYFIKSETAGYLVNVFISPFLDYTQCYHYYWYGASFNVLRFINFYFQVLYLHILLYS